MRSARSFAIRLQNLDISDRGLRAPNWPVPSDLHVCRGPRGDRTLDLRIKSPLLSQLS